MSRLSQAQLKLNDALTALETALASARSTAGPQTTGGSPVDSRRLLADLQSVDSKVTEAVSMINASLAAINGDGEKR